MPQQIRVGQHNGSTYVDAHALADWLSDKALAEANDHSKSIFEYVAQEVRLMALEADLT